MNDLNYKALMNKVEVEDSIEKLAIINKRIDSIISNTSTPKETLEALICMMESYNNVSTSYTTVSVAYAVLIGGCTLLAGKAEFNVFAGFILIGISIALAILSLYIHKNDIKRTFVLHALRFRYELLCNEMTITDEKEYIVKVKLNK